MQRRQLAATLRDARARSGLTIEQVAHELWCSPAKISRIETGKRPASPRDVRDLCRLYALPEDAQKQLVEMAVASRQRGWWEEHNLLPAHASYVGLEAIASSVRDFKSSIVPGLLQTPAYARAIMDSYFAPADPVVLDGLMRARMQRQVGLFKEGAEAPSIHVIMDEAAIRRTVGGPAVMVDQLDRIIDDSEEFDIIVQVVPFVAGAHAGVETTFSILTFDDPSIPSAAFSEDVFGIIQLSSAEELAKCERIFSLVAQTALPGPESLDLLRSVRDEYTALKPRGDAVAGVDDETR
jgi:transcriptional regulator with XRE-family HTH domain